MPSYLVLNYIWKSLVRLYVEHILVKLFKMN